ncbi:2Fe-2S iron-sulfur cluster-binding protein [Caballeronia ptereochthonis]
MVIEPGGYFVAVKDGTSLLEAALQAGLSLPRSCRNGACRACMCRLVDGDIAYRVVSRRPARPSRRPARRARAASDPGISGLSSRINDLRCESRARIRTFSCKERAA